jgi:hypothetical protein
MKRRIAKKLLIAHQQAYWRWWYGCGKCTWVNGRRVRTPNSARYPREQVQPRAIIMRDARKGKLRWVPPAMRELWRPASAGMVALLEKAK